MSPCNNSPDVLLQMAWFLIGLTAELAFIWPVTVRHLQVLLEGQARILGCTEPWWEDANKQHTLNCLTSENRRITVKIQEVRLLPKSVMRMGSCKGMSDRGMLFFDTLALLVFRGNLCFFCCRFLKCEAMCVFLWPDVRKILSQWGQEKGRSPGENTACHVDHKNNFWK